MKTHLSLLITFIAIAFTTACAENPPQSQSITALPIPNSRYGIKDQADELFNQKQWHYELHSFFAVKLVGKPVGHIDLEQGGKLKSCPIYKAVDDKGQSVLLPILPGAPTHGNVLAVSVGSTADDHVIVVCARWNESIIVGIDTTIPPEFLQQRFSRN